MANITEIIKLLSELINIEKKIEERINEEKDLKKRQALKDACEKRDLPAIRKLLFDID
jgi:hypothetical protein